MFALFLLVALSGQWALRVAAGADDFARPGGATAAQTAARAAETDFLEARVQRFERCANERDAPLQAIAPASLFDAIDAVAAEASSDDAKALARSIRASLTHWADAPALPESYAAFAIAMEEARADDLSRQFDLLHDALAAEIAERDALAIERHAGLGIATFGWAIGAPILAALLILMAVRGAPNAPPPAGVVVLDEESRVVYADETSLRSIVGKESKRRAIRSLDDAAFPFRNADMIGESLFAGLESGDEIETADGRSWKVSRLASDCGGAVLVMADLKPPPAPTAAA